MRRNGVITWSGGSLPGSSSVDVNTGVLTWQTMTSDAGTFNGVTLTASDGSLTGSATFNITVDYIRDYFSGNWSAFTGVLNISPRSGTGDFRINNSSGYANAAFFLNSSVNFYNINANGQTTRHEK